MKLCNAPTSFRRLMPAFQQTRLGRCSAAGAFRKNGQRAPTRALILMSMIALLLTISAPLQAQKVKKIAKDRTTFSADETRRDFGEVGNTTPSGIPDGYIVVDCHLISEKDYMSGEAIFDTDFWTNGDVPYEFDDDVTGQQQAWMLSAMDEWEAVAQVDFKPRNGESNYLFIRENPDLDLCNASFSGGTGMNGGMQTMNIGCNKWDDIIHLAHELGHTLGLKHEQVREDRDTYVTINWDNIDDNFEGNYEMSELPVYPKPEYGLSGEETYDFGSIMHYGDFSFCERDDDDNCIGETITVNEPWADEWQDRIGNRDSLSFLDKLTMSFMYPEDDWYFVDKTYWGTENGTFLEPYDNFTTAMNTIPGGGTTWIQPGTYLEDGLFTKETFLRAPLGNVKIGTAANARTGNSAPLAEAGRTRPSPKTGKNIVEADHDGEGAPAIDEISTASIVQLPVSFDILQNYPNPFNPATTIDYQLPTDASVQLKVYNIQGQLISTLVYGVITAGYHSVHWDGTDASGNQVSSGTYIYRLSAGPFVKTMKMVLMR